MTSHEVAQDLIRVYVKRGDTLESIRSGQMGSASSDYWASVGGYFNGKHYDPHWIIVDKIEDIEVGDIFLLEKIYKEIQLEDVQQSLF